jgi:hypothetical protein
LLEGINNKLHCVMIFLEKLIDTELIKNIRTFIQLECS